MKERIIKLIENEMNEVGFICDSDNVERFVDTEIKRLLNNDEDEYEKYFDDLVGFAQSYLDENYKRVCEVAENGDYTGYFYKNNLQFETVEELEDYFGIY